MKIKYLFPHSFLKIGWMLFIPSAALGVATLKEFKFAFLNFNCSFYPQSKMSFADNNFTNELAAFGVMLGLMFIGFAKERIEDEQIASIRLESLQWSIYLNYILLAMAMITVNGLDFMSVMMYNLFTPLLFFVIRFKLLLYKQRKYNMEDAHAK